MFSFQDSGDPEGAAGAAGGEVLSVPETRRQESGGEAGSRVVGRERPEVSLSALARLERANRLVKLAMARELAAGGLSEEAVQRVLHLPEGLCEGFERPSDARPELPPRKEP